MGLSAVEIRLMLIQYNPAAQHAQEINGDNINTLSTPTSTRAGEEDSVNLDNWDEVE